MRGFVVGSLSLIVLYVVVQPSAAGRLASGSNVLVRMFTRALAPDVAGVPRRGAGKLVGNVGHKSGSPGANGKKPA